MEKTIKCKDCGYEEEFEDNGVNWTVCQMVVWLKMVNGYAKIVVLKEDCWMQTKTMDAN